MKSLLVRLRPSHLFLAFSVITLLMAFMLSTFMFTQAHASPSAAPRLSVQFTCAQAINKRSGSICVHTQARAVLSIRIRYCTNYYAVSRSLLGSQYADIRGNHTWTWIPNTKCRGIAYAYVAETYGGHTLNVWTRFIVK